ncbi:MAG: RDD family protein [Mycobacterium sp.]
MTTVLEETPALETAAEAPPPVADWGLRVGSFALDVLPGAGVLAALLLTSWSVPLRGWQWWVCAITAALVFLAVAANRLLLPVITGWSLGRLVFGIRVVGADNSVPGPARLLLRDLAHLIDTLPLLLGWLWPLLDPRGRTFADLLTRTEVRPVDGPRPDRRRLAAALVAGAAVIGVLAAGLGYFSVYRQEHAVTQARAAIALEGPKIVSQVLSYRAVSVREDFDRARALVTDDYRPQLVAQQDAVTKAGPVDNDYWITNSAVLSSSRDQAEMLLLMQGQRGTGDKQRLITATVRAAFAKSAAGQWQVSNLTVLARPNAAGRGS